MTNVPIATIDMYKKTLGTILIVGSLFTFAMGRWPDSASVMQSSTNITSNHFYGLNMDMHLERSLVVILILGMVLYISSKKETEL